MVNTAGMPAVIMFDSAILLPCFLPVFLPSTVNLGVPAGYIGAPPQRPSNPPYHKRCKMLYWGYEESGVI